MDFLGIGPLEVVFILLISIIIFGPKDIVKAGQSAGKFLRKMVKSPGWKAVQQTSKDLRNLPNKLMREAGLDEIKNEVESFKSIAKPPEITQEIKAELDKVGEGLSAWTSPTPEIQVPQVPDDETPPPGDNGSQQTENN